MVVLVAAETVRFAIFDLTAAEVFARTLDIAVAIRRQTTTIVARCGCGRKEGEKRQEKEMQGAEGAVCAKRRPLFRCSCHCDEVVRLALDLRFHRRVD